jgi:hypothetical protein
VITLWGGAPEHEKRTSYAPFIGALEGLAFRMAPAGLRALLGEAAPALAPLVPALAAALGSEQPAWEAGLPAPERLAAALADFLTHLAARAPVLLVLDDLHAADAASLQLLGALGRALRAEPILLLGTYQPVDSGPLLLGELTMEHLAETVQLPPLGPRETSRLITVLLGAPAAPAVAERVHRLAAGNLSRIAEAVYALRGRGHLQQGAGLWRLAEEPAFAPESFRLRRRPRPGR